MTGIEYFQKYGWSHAVQSVSRIPSEYNEYSPDLKTVVVNGNFRYAMAAEISKKKTEVYVTELKQIIESEKLLEDFFNLNLVGIEKGLSNAKREMQDMEEQGIVEFNHRFDDDLTCTTERMKLAIAQIDHLYQNNITKSEYRCRREVVITSHITDFFIFNNCRGTFYSWINYCKTSFSIVARLKKSRH